MDVHELKLDGTFIDDAATEVGQSVLEGVISIAHAVGLPVVAERIETRAQVQLLRRLGCDLVRGSSSVRGCRPRSRLSG